MRRGPTRGLPVRHPQRRLPGHTRLRLPPKLTHGQVLQDANVPHRAPPPLGRVLKLRALDTLVSNLSSTEGGPPDTSGSEPVRNRSQQVYTHLPALLVRARTTAALRGFPQVYTHLLAGRGRWELPVGRTGGSSFRAAVKPQPRGSLRLRLEFSTHFCFICFVFFDFFRFLLTFFEFCRIPWFSFELCRFLSMSLVFYSCLTFSLILYRCSSKFFDLYVCCSELL